MSNGNILDKYTKKTFMRREKVARKLFGNLKQINPSGYLYMWYSYTETKFLNLAL
jgi:hypothetical protein